MCSNLTLEKGISIILKKTKGNSVIEFKRHDDPVLDNIVEMWKYDSKKKNKGKSTWIILKDLPGFVDFYLNSCGYMMDSEETIPKKISKKK